MESLAASESMNRGSPRLQAAFMRVTWTHITDLRLLLQILTSFSNRDIFPLRRRYVVLTAIEDGGTSFYSSGEAWTLGLYPNKYSRTTLC